MYRTHTCGELRLENVGQKVTLAGWVQKARKLGGMTFVDLRDRYGITQLVTEQEIEAGREWVLQIKGEVVERQSKNPKMPTGDIEIRIESVNVLNRADTPPFTIEEVSDGGEDIRAKYRYLDLRRAPLQRALALRHRLAQEVRSYLDKQGFMEIETPYLIKSTPEGARDFVVPSRMNPGQFYALPQSPQTFKQLLMVAGYDRYFQIVRCFRDEDLRADRQPEFTQIDCEMSFVEQEDVLNTFEGMMRQMFKNALNVDIPNPLPRMSWYDAMDFYGSDKPDVRFGMKIHEITDLAHGHDFSVFDSCEYVGAIVVPGAAEYTRKQLDELTEWVKRPQVGAKGLVYIKANADGTFKSSIDKFFTEADLAKIAGVCEAGKGDLILVLCGAKRKAQTMLGVLRIEMGNRLGLRDPKVFAPLWIVDFPLLEWDDETQRFYAMHHPFTMPMEECLGYLDTDPANVRAKAWDLVLNGTELSSGSMRITDFELQQKMFAALGMTDEEIQAKFGFLVDAYRYGAPPHGGMGIGLDRIAMIMCQADSLRDVTAFPKVQNASELMSECPSFVDDESLDVLGIKIDKKNNE